MAKDYPHNESCASALTYERADAINTAIRLIGIRHRTLAAAALAELNLHPGQEALVMELAALGPRTQVQLAAGIGCEPPTVTLMARKLEAAGLITRHQSPTDARAVVVDLTDAGHALMPRLRAAWYALAAQTVAEFTAVPVDQLAAVLDDLARSLGVARYPCVNPSPRPS